MSLIGSCLVRITVPFCMWTLIKTLCVSCYFHPIGTCHPTKTWRIWSGALVEPFMVIYLCYYCLLLLGWVL